jgi:hypothetical protein
MGKEPESHKDGQMSQPNWDGLSQAEQEIMEVAGMDWGSLAELPAWLSNVMEGAAREELLAFAQETVRSLLRRELILTGFTPDEREQFEPRPITEADLADPENWRPVGSENIWGITATDEGQRVYTSRWRA